jgi:hypothetical protein
MDTPVSVALIGAGGTVLAAAITVTLTRVLGGKNATPAQPEVNPRRPAPADASSGEQALRRDERVVRLLNNSNWKDAAEAAIACFSRGVECPIESWRKSSTWQQVKVVFDELCAHRA